MTELWIRNPVTCIRECAELCVPNIAWDRGFARKNRLDPQRHLELHYSAAVDYRILMVGDQGTAELRRGYSMESPYAVYPTWEYGVQTIPELEQMLADPPTTQTYAAPADERPVPGQEHRVVIIRAPGAQSPEGKALHRTLRELSDDYPDALVHFHGTYSWRIAFGLGWGAADIDPVMDARKGRIVLGSGRSIEWEKAPDYEQWINLLGFSCSQLKVNRNRTMFNIKSAEWASRYYSDAISFKSRGPAVVDARSPDPSPATAKTIYRGKAQLGDKLACDHCSLPNTCKYFRVGGVCAIPDSDGSSLAKHFKTRDSDQIIEGLGKLLAQQAKRLKRGVENEEAGDGSLDPEVTKLEGQMFNNGVKLAKLVDPALAAAGATRIQIANINGGGNGGANMTPQALMAQAVRELEAQGLTRDEITPLVVAEYLASSNRKAIEASAQEVSP